MRILFVGGNSGGHIFPLIAVWHEVRKLDPSAVASFICSEKDEDGEMLAPEGCTITQIPTPRLSLALPFTFLRGTQLSTQVIDSFRPDVIFSKGGAVSVPVCRVAHQKKIPIVLHESDTVMGRANRMIARWADVVCTGFEATVSPQQEANDQTTKNQKPKTKNPIFTGNPIRAELTSSERQAGLLVTKFSGKKPVLLVTGGSQGAVALNEWVKRNVDELRAVCDVIHLTGRGKAGAPRREGYIPIEFAGAELADLYAAADLAVSRAGAGAITELAANGIPALLVPLPGLAQDHQTANAVAAAQSGGCVHVPQSAMDKTLLQTVQEIAQDKEKRQKMSSAIRTLHHPDAARRIAEIVLGSVAKS